MNWISGFAILLLVAGLIVGLSLSGTDLLNPQTSQAEAERIQAETRHLDVMNQLEEQRAVAKTEAEIARTRRQQELEEARYQAELARIAAAARQAEMDLLQDQEMHMQTMASRQRLANAGIVIIGIFGSAMSIGVIILAIRMTVPKKVAAIPVRQNKIHKPTIGNSMRVKVIPVRYSYEPSNLPTYQQSIIREACENERPARDDQAVDARLHSVCHPTPRVRIIGKRYYSLPPAH